MEIALPKSSTEADRRPRWASLAAVRWGGWRTLALGLIVLLAAALRFVNLGALGYANHYYTAGIVSMLQSWHNFFFAAAEPGGAVSIDKPPVGLWLQAVSAYFLGINGLAMVLPEILCGLLSIVVLYHLVRRAFGAGAGLLAALALALTPIVVATDRNNTIDSSLILTLLLATWAFIRATESGRLRWLLLGAGLVGVGFNIKMLQAVLPLPAFYAHYFLGANTRLWRKLANLTLATVLLLAVSLSWAVAVDITPASERPYVGSSNNNSELNLAIGYNGVERLVGMRSSLANFWQRLTGSLSGTARGGGAPFNSSGGPFNPPGAPASRGQGNQPPLGQSPGQGNPPAIGQAPAQGNPPSFGQPPASGQALGNRTRPQQNGGFGAPGSFGRGGAGGSMSVGLSGPLRLFTAPLNKEVSWLLPFGLFSLALLLFRARPRWPLSLPHQAAVLWGGWLITGGIFFSVAGFFHEYYLAMLAAPLAALVGIGLAELWRLRERHPWLSLGLLLAAAATVGFQYYTATSFAGRVAWLVAPVAVAGVGATLAGLGTATRRRLSLTAGTAILGGAMFFTPGVWSGLTALNTAANQSLPAAYSGRASAPVNGGGLQVNQALLAYLQANTQGIEYLMAVPSAMQGADYIIATGRPVLYLGGFMGQDQVLTADGLAEMVAQGRLRYIYYGGDRGGPGRGSQSDVSTWVTAHCSLVSGFETDARNSGAPDGTNAAGGNPATQVNGAFGGAMQIALYDCGALNK